MQTVTEEPHTISGNRKVFEGKVAQEARGLADPEFAEWLRQEENVPQWRQALSDLARSIDAQQLEHAASLAELQQECHQINTYQSKQHYFAAKAEDDRWRADAGRFKAGVMSRLQESKQLVREAADRRYTNGPGSLTEMVAELVQAMHRIEFQVNALYERLDQ